MKLCTGKHQSIGITAVLVSHSNTKSPPAQLPRAMRSSRHELHAAQALGALTSCFARMSNTLEEGCGMESGKHGKTGASPGAVIFPLASRAVDL